MVRISTKSAKPFMIYSENKNLTLKFDLRPWAKVNKISCFEQFILLIIRWKFGQNRSSRSWFIAKLRIWPWNLTFDLGPRSTKFHFFKLFVLLIIWWKFRQNRPSRSWFIAKIKIWPSILTFDLGVKVMRKRNFPKFSKLHPWSKFEQNRTSHLREKRLLSQQEEQEDPQVQRLTVVHYSSSR